MKVEAGFSNLEKIL